MDQPNESTLFQGSSWQVVLIYREANALARLLNNRCLRLDSELEPLVSIANEPMYDFPLSYGALDLLPGKLS